MKTKNFISVLVCIIICELAGMIGSIFTTPAINGWYAGLVRPFLNPPNWIFAPVWTLLFALMGVALFLVWKKGIKSKEVKMAVKVFGLQLILNVLWSIIFFGLHNPAWAFGEIVILWLAILWTIVTFYKISKPASYLLIPYILWVSFASYLNLSLWLLN
jgi:tryptophan-rich sensory protein